MEKQLTNMRQLFDSAKNINDTMQAMKTQQENTATEVRSMTVAIEKNQRSLEAESSVMTVMNQNLKQLMTMSKSPPTLQAKNNEPEVARKKGLFFTSSIGKDIDTKLMSDKLNIDIDKVMVYNVERNDSSKDPEKNLVEKLREHVNDDVSTVIIQCGSVDVTAAMTAANVNNVTKAAETMVSQAADFAQATDCDIFISQAPPRYDDEILGKGDLSKLTEALNSTSRTQSLFLERVHTVPQGRLASTGKQLETRYQSDGIHLTEIGSGILTKNLI